MDCKKRKEHIFYLRLRWLLLHAMAKVVLALAVRGWVCGPRYIVPVEGAY